MARQCGKAYSWGSQIQVHFPWVCMSSWVDGGTCSGDIGALAGSHFLLSSLQVLSERATEQPLARNTRPIVETAKTLARNSLQSAASDKTSMAPAFITHWISGSAVGWVRNTLEVSVRNAQLASAEAWARRILICLFKQYLDSVGICPAVSVLSFAVTLFWAVAIAGNGALSKFPCPCFHPHRPKDSASSTSEA